MKAFIDTEETAKNREYSSELLVMDNYDGRGGKDFLYLGIEGPYPCLALDKPSALELIKEIQRIIDSQPPSED